MPVVFHLHCCAILQSQQGEFHCQLWKSILSPFAIKCPSGTVASKYICKLKNTSWSSYKHIFSCIIEGITCIYNTFHCFSELWFNLIQRKTCSFCSAWKKIILNDKSFFNKKEWASIFWNEHIMKPFILCSEIYLHSFKK